jgi:CRP/FNR family transcriptional regulator
MLFAELSDEEMDKLAQIVTFTNLPKSGLLFLEGDHAGAFFVLLSGSVRIFKSSSEGREYTLHRIVPGQMFAEAAIFKGDTYPASCMALADSEVAVFPKEQTLQLVKAYPQIAFKIMGGLAAWLREFTMKLEALSLKEVPARLASYILRQVERTGEKSFDLPTTKTELATELGTISETLSRSMRKLKEAGIIETEGRNIRVLDLTRLKATIEEGKI